MKKLLLGVTLSLALTSVFAQNNQEMLKKIQKENPNLGVSKVTYLPEIKLYEIRTNKSKALSYTNENMDYFILNGQILDPKSKKNVSVERDMNVIKDFFKDLPFNKSIPIKFGNGERKIAVFTDPDCPYCKAADQAIDAYMKKDNITFYYFMNPLNIVGHEDAPLKAKKIWCSPDKAASWKKWMLEGVLPNNAGTCSNPVAETKALAAENNFTSTPTFVFDNGFIWRGQISPDQIREVLNKKGP